MRDFCRGLAVLSTSVFFLKNPLSRDLRDVWIPCLKRPFVDHSEKIVLALVYIALFAMVLAIRSAHPVYL